MRLSAGQLGRGVRMAAQRLRIERITVSELLPFAERHYQAASRQHVVPISRLRAIAQAARPGAADDDLALLVAMMGEKCVGYLGLLPGRLRIGEELTDVYWYSTWYISPAARSTGAGALLVLATLALDVDLLATGLAPEVRAIYKRFGFRTLGPLPYYRLQMWRYDVAGALLLAIRTLQRRRGNTTSKWLDKTFLGARALSKAIFYRMLRIMAASLLKRFDIREHETLPDDAFASPQQREPRVCFDRDRQQISWMLEYPWVSDEADQSTPGYYFSDVRELFRQLVVEVRTRAPARLLGHVIVTISRDNGITTIKLLDTDLPRSGQAEELATSEALSAVALSYAVRYRADDVQLPPVSGAYIRRSLPLRALFREDHQSYFCYPRRTDSPLAKVMGEIALTVCDGDKAFW